MYGLGFYKEHMKTRYKILGGIVLMLGLQGVALANPKAATVEDEFKAALFCQTEAFDARDAKTVARLGEHNIKVKNLEEDGLINQEFHFATPFNIDNVTVSVVRYLGDSGSYFFAIAKGDMNNFAQSIGAKPIPNELKQTLSWGNINQYYKYTAPATTDNPYPKTVLIGRDQDTKTGEFYFGCLEVDN